MARESGRRVVEGDADMRITPKYHDTMKVSLGRWLAYHASQVMEWAWWRLYAWKGCLRDYAITGRWDEIPF